MNIWDDNLLDYSLELRLGDDWGADQNKWSQLYFTNGRKANFANLAIEAQPPVASQTSVPEPSAAIGLLLLGGLGIAARLARRQA